MENKAYLAVWKRQMEGKNNDRYHKAGINCTDNSLSIPLEKLSFTGGEIQISCLYPKNDPVPFELDKDVLTVYYDGPVMARLFLLENLPSVH